MNNKIELSFSDIFLILKRKFILILIITVLCGACAGILTKILIDPVFTSRITFYVYGDSQRNNQTITSTDLSVSKQLVGTYIAILNSDTVMDKVSESLSLEYSADRMRSFITSSVVTGTEIFNVVVKHPNAQLAYDIAQKIGEIAPGEIVRIVNAGGSEIIDVPKVSTLADSPMKKNLMIGAAAGLILSCIIFVLKSIFDTKVRSIEDITKHFEYPILGEVPNLDFNKQKK